MDTKRHPTQQPLDVGKIIDDLGGTAAVARECEITDGAVSQWRSNNFIPKPWLKYLRERFPEKFGIDRRKRERRYPRRVA